MSDYPTIEVDGQVYGPAQIRLLREENAKLRKERSKFDAAHDWDAAMRENTKLREALQAIADESQRHHEHNPVSGIDRLPRGYTTIQNLACAALK